MLDVGVGTCDRIANSKQQFAEFADTADAVASWFMTDLVDRLVEAGLILQAGHCYSFKVPPALGGEYDVGNIFTLPVGKHLAAYAHIHSQLKDLPDGASVELKVKS